MPVSLGTSLRSDVSLWYIFKHLCKHDRWVFSFFSVSLEPGGETFIALETEVWNQACATTRRLKEMQHKCVNKSSFTGFILASKKCKFNKGHGGRWSCQLLLKSPTFHQLLLKTAVWMCLDTTPFWVQPSSSAQLEDCTSWYFLLTKYCETAVL